MYCTNCGNKLNEGKNFCGVCGMNISADVTRSTATTVSAAGSVTGSVAGSVAGSTAESAGYSNRIGDPAFAKYIKNNNRWSGIFAVILAIAAVIGFYIAGETSSEMDNPESLYIGFGIGGMFLLIALFQIAGRKKSRQWDGVVVDKRIHKKRHSQGSGDNDHWVEYMEYVVYIRSDDGRKYKIAVKDNDTIYNYYEIGDKIRHHKGLNSYEKYDKSKDTIIFCNACASLNNINDDNCFRCKCPLLK